MPYHLSFTSLAFQLYLSQIRFWHYKKDCPDIEQSKKSKLKSNLIIIAKLLEILFTSVLNTVIFSDNIQQEFPSFNSKHPSMTQFFIRNYTHDLTVYEKCTQYWRNRLWILTLFTIFEDIITWNYNYISIALVCCMIMTFKIKEQYHCWNKVNLVLQFDSLQLLPAVANEKGIQTEKYFPNYVLYILKKHHPQAYLAAYDFIEKRAFVLHWCVLNVFLDNRISISF